MKKMILCLCLLLIVGLLVACGRNGDDDTPADEQDTQAQEDTTVATPEPAPTEDPVAATGPDAIDWDEHVTFTWWKMATFGDFWASYNDNPVIHYLQHRFNVTFEFEQPVAGTESDALSLMMGTGRYTNVMGLAQYVGSIAQLYEDGIILNIADWLDYMPNLRHLLETNADFNRAARDDFGRILTFPSIADESELTWSGLMYRHDILETMTDGNVNFPSGNDRPTTLEDWEWMLPLMKEYFENAGIADFAPLILPADGTIAFGEIMSTFGAFHSTYVRDNEVHHGLLEPAMFEYVSTMRDWFERGWIHQDFASRTEDLFFMPNPPLVFGGSAGVFYGLVMHLGDRMSLPEFGMYFDVRPIPSPMIEGVTSERDMIRRGWDLFGGGISNAVYSGTENIGRLMAIVDHLYSDEGSFLVTVGLRAEQIPTGTAHDVMDAMGMLDGAYWFDDSGNFVLHPNFQVMGGHVGFTDANGARLPGFQRFSLTNEAAGGDGVDAHLAWSGHDRYTEVFPLPAAVSMTAEESSIVSANNARMTDHFNQQMVMFIMGTAPLNEETWAEFINQQIDFGLEENLAIQRAAFARYLARG